MKFVALCLFACIAVSSAAFTSNLVQQAQPLLDQAFFKVRLASSSRSELQTSLVQGLQDQANAILEQIQNGVNLAQDVVAGLVQQFQDTQAQIAALTSVITSNVSEIIGNLIGSLGNLFGGLFGKGVATKGFSFGGLFNAITEQLTSLVQSLNLPGLLTNALNEHLPAGVAEFLISQLGLAKSNRGLWDTITGAIGGAVGALWDQLASLAGTVVDVASSAFTHVQQLASDFVAEATAHAGAVSQQAISQMIEFLRPYGEDLGAVWGQLQALLN